MIFKICQESVFEAICQPYPKYNGLDFEVNRLDYRLFVTYLYKYNEAKPRACSGLTGQGSKVIVGFLKTCFEPDDVRYDICIVYL